MAGGLRFADVGANHFPSFRAWPKTFGDLISSDTRFVGHFRVFLPLAGVDGFQPVWIIITLAGIPPHKHPQPKVVPARPKAKRAPR
jgi:hypothetical protein